MTEGTACPPLEDILEIAQTAARQAGRVLLEGFRQPKQVRYKGETDPVTQFDLASEKTIVGLISGVYPDHGILAEEGGETTHSSAHRWYIDPLDGTVNFAHGVPVFAVSIAFESCDGLEPEVKVGVIYDPVHDELFSAVKGQGARLNGRPIHVSDQDLMIRALIATGFPYDLHTQPDPVLDRFRRMCLAAQGVRRPGAAAIDLAWLAAGRVDGFFEEKLQPWDTAAGVLLVREAGGRVTDYSDIPHLPERKEILATNGHLHYTMLQVLNQQTGSDQ